MLSSDDSPALNNVRSFLAEDLLTEPEIKPLGIQSILSSTQKNLWS